jgi:tripartite-type tricarboxylate transporter receptor subunit TctC
VRHQISGHGDRCAIKPFRTAGNPEENTMKLHRRHFLRLAASAVALPALSRIASAQPYPTRPVRIIVGFGAGGASDIFARLIGQALSERLGGSFIVENRPGAAGNIAAEAVVNAPADGYTLLLTQSGNAINATLYERLNFDFIRDVAPVAGIAIDPGVMEVSPSFPAKTVPEFIAYAKARPGKITMATSGSGSVGHLWGEMFKMMTGVDLVAVPYRGGSGPVLTDLMGGQVDVAFDPLPSSMEFVKAGKLRALAVTSAERSEILPEVPTIDEFVPGYDASAWLGIGAPKSTPAEIVDKLNKEVNAVLADPRMKRRIADLGAAVLVKSPTDLAKFVTKDTEKWGKVIRAANIKAD